MKKKGASSFNPKKFVTSIPLIGRAASKLAHLPISESLRRRTFCGSASFWENRYRVGGTSGSGSYGRLAEFKAEILNEFVRRQEIHTVIEFGCGDGAQLELAAYPEYVGVDVAEGAIDRCSTRFAHDPTKRFYLPQALPQNVGTFDLALSLDVIYHLVEDDTFNSHMRWLFTRSQRYVAIYASNYDARTHSVHVRHRNFTRWIVRNMPDWHAVGFVPNRFPWDDNQPNDTSFADFYFFTRSIAGGCRNRMDHGG